MDTINESKAWFAEAFAFEGDYIYVPFGKMGGLCKVNRKDTSQYTRVMGDFQTTVQVPTCFVLGDDGDIYYVSKYSPHIYVLNVDITEEERLRKEKEPEQIIEELASGARVTEYDKALRGVIHEGGTD